VIVIDPGRERGGSGGGGATSTATAAVTGARRCPQRHAGTERGTRRLHTGQVQVYEGCSTSMSALTMYRTVAVGGSEKVQKE
jgi:hypothetical protein